MQNQNILKRNLLFAIQHIQDTCRVKTYIFDHDNNQLSVDGELLVASKSDTNFIPSKELVIAAKKACHIDDCPQIWRETEKVFYSGIRLSTTGRYFLIGPMAANRLTDEEYIHYAQSHNCLLNTLFIPYVTASQVINSNSTFCYLVADTVLTRETITHLNTVIAELYLSRWITYRLDAIEHSRHSYEDEMEWFKQITNGTYRYDEAEIADQDLEYQEVGVLAEEPTKQIEYTYISAITLICRAAINGGLDPFASYSLSDVFFQKISECHTERDMKRTYLLAIKTFSGMIQDAKDNRTQNGVCERCKLYIDQNMYEKISVQTIADAIGISANHLSTVFAKETETTLTKYIHRKRLDRASELLKHSNMEINEISEKLMFCSQSYMTSLFKQQFGLTPQKYRIRYGIHTMKSYL